MTEDLLHSSHPLLDVSARLEKATDAYATAFDAEADAENEYLRKHAIAYAKAAAEGVAATMRDKHANAQPDVVEARCAFNLASARSKSPATERTASDVRSVGLKPIASAL